MVRYRVEHTAEPGETNGSSERVPYDGVFAAGIKKLSL